jgi:hypothetical protein
VGLVPRADLAHRLQRPREHVVGGGGEQGLERLLGGVVQRSRAIERLGARGLRRPRRPGRPLPRALEAVGGDAAGGGAHRLGPVAQHPEQVRDVGPGLAVAVLAPGPAVGEAGPARRAFDRVGRGREGDVSDTPLARACGRDRRAQRRHQVRRRGPVGAGVIADQRRQLAQPLDLRGRVDHHEADHDVVGIGTVAAEALDQPGVEGVVEGERRGGRVQDRGAGVDVRLDGVGLHEVAREAVDRRAGQVVEVGRGAAEVRELRGVRPGGQRGRDRGVDDAVEQLVDEAVHAVGELGGRELGEGDGGDRGGRDALGQEQGDPARHQRGLARAGARLDEEAAVAPGERAPAMLDVDERRHASAPSAVDSARATGPSASAKASALRRA